MRGRGLALWAARAPPRLLSWAAEIDRDEVTSLIETLAEKLHDINLTRLDAAVQRA